MALPYVETAVRSTVDFTKEASTLTVKDFKKVISEKILLQVKKIDDEPKHQIMTIEYKEQDGISIADVARSIVDDSVMTDLCNPAVYQETQLNTLDRTVAKESIVIGTIAIPAYPGFMIMLLSESGLHAVSTTNKISKDFIADDDFFKILPGGCLNNEEMISLSEQYGYLIVVMKPIQA